MQSVSENNIHTWRAFMKTPFILAWLLMIASSVFAQATVTITGTDLSPAFSPGTSTPVVSLSFSAIVGSPQIYKIKVDRTGTATDTDVPTAKLYEDVNQNNIVDAGDVLIDSAWFSSGTLLFRIDSYYYPSSSKNLLIVYNVAAVANTNNTIGANLAAGYITGGNLTVIIFTGVTSGDQPLPVGLTSFDALVQNNIVNLKWSTATEVNVYKFEVERKAAAQNKIGNIWEKISEISANGNSNSTKSYSYEDKNLEAGDYQYRLKTIDLNGSFSYSNSAFAKISAPEKFVLSQNYPNPFNPSTNISYQLPADGNVSLKIYDAIGREVSTLVNTFQKAGYHNLKFDASQFSSGIYFYRLIFGSTDSGNNYTEIKKMILVR